MKRYYQTPQMEVITIQNPVILAGSGERVRGTTIYEEGFDSSSEALVRRSTFNLWDEDEEEE